MGFTTTPNMGLVLANPAGSASPEPGPQYAADNNQSFTTLDSHNHSPGSGVQITPAGIDINTNLPFGNNSATSIYGIQFSVPASSVLTTFLYTNAQAGGGIIDLFYNDGAGNVIAITKGGEVNATIASLPGESYAGGTFTWKQGDGSTTPANFDIGSVTIRPNTASTTNGVVLNPPSAIASQYDLQLPLVPASNTGILQVDTSGNMISTLVPDNATIVISSQTLEVGSIQTANIADSAVTTAKIADGAVTQPKLAASTATTFTSSSTFTVPSNVNYLFITACGGGGGGGEANAVGDAGGGGGGGAPVFNGIIPVTAGSTYTVTIGSGGSGANGGSAGAGNATSFGAVLSCPGGNLATNGTSASVAGSGGTGKGNAGNNGGTGITSVGGAGGASYLSSMNFGNGGNGQAAANGTGGGGGGSYGAGAAGSSGGGAGGNAAANTGGGGGGGSNAKGGNGGSGIMIVYIV